MIRYIIGHKIYVKRLELVRPNIVISNSDDKSIKIWNTITS